MTVPSVVSFVACQRSFCENKGDNGSTFKQDSASVWTFPISLNDSRATVHKVLGAASRTTAELEEYATSGLSIWYDSYNRITKINFSGVASILYSNDSFHALPTKRKIVFGLNGYSNESQFRSALGVPEKDNLERSSRFKELHCIWKKNGYIIDALFLAVERNLDGKEYSKGSLLWFETYRGL